MNQIVKSYSPRDRERYLTEGPKSDLRSDFSRDRARIMYSAGLRRLGAKTQVLGPSSDDFVRTRLTHSLEVSQVGRTIAQELGSDPDIVDAACQAHDLGHPPFGHNGERALNEIAKSIGGFEGNAQTFRLLTRLEPKILSPEGKPLGLNLTRATLDAVCKYPWGKGSGPDQEKSLKKYNAYPEDQEIFTWVREYSPGQNRCLEAQIMDISDDIAYSVHDFEDAIQNYSVKLEQLKEEKQREKIYAVTTTWYGSGISPDELEKAWERLSALPNWLHHYDGSYRAMVALKDMTSELIGRFCLAVTRATRAEAGDDPLHRYDCDLVIPEETNAEIRLLKGIAVNYVMAPREYEPVYLQQRTVLFDLADALMDHPERWEKLYRDAYYEAADHQGQLRALVDQLAALTDTSAHMWHGSHCGMFSQV